MVRLDIVKAKTVETSMAESKKRLKKLCETVAEFVGEMKRASEMYEIRMELDKQLEEMEQSLYLLTKLNECLQRILPLYMKCEENIMVYVEEVQAIKEESVIGISEIPEWVFRLLG